MPSDGLVQISSIATRYKPSRYNILVAKGKGAVLFNSFSTALARLDSEQYGIVRRILEGNSEAAESTAEESLRQQLIKGNFLIPESMDEIKWLKTKNRLTRFTSPELGMIVAPTLRCNFACEYCYVDLNANKMSTETRRRVKAFFDYRLQPGSAANVVFTGGDPSLAMDVVEELSTFFQQACDAKSCRYSPALITNGYLLDEEMSRALLAGNIHDVQISLDGSREYHDVTRCLAGGKPTFDRILDNIASCCEAIRCHLRINVTLENHQAIPGLLDELARRGIASRVAVYFSPVDDVNENSHGYAQHVLEPAAYAQFEPTLIRKAIACGFTMSGYLMHKSIGQFCGANSHNYFVVDSNGSLLKCYHDFGSADSKGIGYINEDGKEVITSEDNLVKWLSWDPFEIDECSHCRVLPLCMGGCSHKIMNSGMNVEKGCLTLRMNVEEIVALYDDAFADGRAYQLRCSKCAGASLAPHA